MRLVRQSQRLYPLLRRIRRSTLDAHSCVFGHCRERNRIRRVHDILPHAVRS
jgi:hypothetical protein